MSYRNAVSGDCGVALLVFFVQEILLTALFRQDSVAVQFLQTHVAGVGDGFGVGMGSDL